VIDPATLESVGRVLVSLVTNVDYLSN
jgi:hypothetical protein